MIAVRPQLVVEEFKCRRDVEVVRLDVAHCCTVASGEAVGKRPHHWLMPSRIDFWR